MYNTIKYTYGPKTRPRRQDHLQKISAANRKHNERIILLYIMCTIIGFGSIWKQHNERHARRYNLNSRSCMNLYDDNAYKKFTVLRVTIIFCI